MKKELPFWLGLTIIIFAALIAGLVAYWSFANIEKSLEGENFTNIEAPSLRILSSRSSVPSWATYADPNGLFSFQYPTSYGSPWITTSSYDKTVRTDFVIESTATSTNSSNSANSLDMTITPNDLLDKSVYTRSLPEGTVSISGGVGTIYQEKGSYPSVWISSTVPGNTSTYFIGFSNAEMGLTPDESPLPPYWHQILSSFKVL